MNAYGSLTDPLTAQTQGYLDGILTASTRPGVVEALEAGHTYLRRLYDFKLLTSVDMVRLSRLWSVAAADRLRELPAPGAPLPAGLFGAWSA